MMIRDMRKRKSWNPVCLECGELKKVADFSIKKNRHKTDKVYRNSYCKACMSKRMKEWREKNKEKYREYQNNYHKRKKAL